MSKMKNKQREIKFKAVFTYEDGKKVVSINSFTVQELASYEEHEWEFSDGGTLPANDVEEGDLEYIEFTGLKDKNGVEIYEGAILKNTKHKNQLVEVYWEGCFTEESSVNGSHWIDWGGWNFRKVNKDNEMTMAIYDNDIEVIGNIYENPNLLKTK